MKIGVLTLPLHTNYGGILQAYALQQVLRRLGHDAVMLDRNRYPLPVWYLRPIVYGKRIFCKFVLKKKLSVFLERDKRREQRMKQRHTLKFVDKYIARQTFKQYDEIKNGKYDCLIVGSDQIWRQMYANSMMGGIVHSFLDFAAEWQLKRIAYAASFGTDTWEYTDEETKQCKELAKSFSLITVREESGQKLCRDYLDCDAQTAPDPTMLLTKDDYERIIGKPSPDSPSAGKLVIYILDKNPETDCIVEAVANRMQLDTYFSNSQVDNRKLPMSQRIQPPVEQWLRSFQDAAFVITDSFHACVFSIIFNKQFAVLGNEKRGMSRFTSLLGQFGLNSRLTTSADKICGLTAIDYAPINQTADKLREKYIEMLQKTLISK